MDRAFESATIMGLTFKNRIVHEPTTMNMSDPFGHMTDKCVGVYESLARGGFSAVIVGATCVRHEGLINERMLGIYDDTYVIGLREVVEVIHNNDCLAGIQLFYGGTIPGLGTTVPLNPGEGWIPGTKALGPSDKFPIGNQFPAIASTEKCESLVEDYAQGARRAKEAGFDFVSFHFCHGSFAHTMLSHLVNIGRSDKYADRFLFCEEVIERTQRLCGTDYPILPRLCCDEILEGGYDIEYFAEHYARRLRRLGIAVLDCTFGSMVPGKSRRKDIHATEYIGGGFYCPPLVNLDNVRKLKRLLIEKNINMPLIGSCRVDTPDNVRTMVQEGAADFAGSCRFSLDDPDFPNKMRQGREREIRKSTHTGASLLQGNIFGKGWAGSPQNAAFGRDRAYRITRTSAPRKIVIVGGGSGGMEYARLATLIGHKVVLFERCRALGGVMDWAGNYEHIPNMGTIRYEPEYLVYQMQLLQVDCRLGVSANADSILMEAPDVAVIATGARAKLPGFVGLESGRETRFVLTMDEVMARQDPIVPGQRVVVYGAGEGMELALDLARRGLEVRVLDPAETVVPVDYIGSRAGHVHRWLAEAGVRIECGVRLDRIGHKSIQVTRGMVTDGMASSGPAATAPGRSEEIACDSVIICLGRESVRDLPPALAARNVPVQVIGDARKPRSYGNAVHEANYLVRQI